MTDTRHPSRSVRIREASRMVLRADPNATEALAALHAGAAMPAGVENAWRHWASVSSTDGAAKMSAGADLDLVLNRWANTLEGVDSIELAQAVRDAGGGPSEEELAENRKPPRGAKHDSGKPRWTLFPLLAVTRIVDVLEFGAAKYGVDNWRHVDELRDRYIDAVYRHIAAWRSGETRDPDSGLPHLAHAICSLVFILTIDEEETPTR